MRQMKQTEIDKITAPGMHRCDRGLYLQVSGEESRSWIYRYTFRGKARWLGLGSAGEVTLAQARNARDDARALIRRGIDPVQERKDSKAKAGLQERNAVPFRERAEQYIKAHESGWKNAKHREQWRATLSTYVYPTIGDVPAALITAGHIVDLLRPIWAQKQETARRVRGRIESILDFAADPDDSTYRNPASMTAQLLKKLPKAKRERKNHPALLYDEAPAFFADLQKREGMAALALQFTILTAARTNEAIAAQWPEFDFDNSLWSVSADRMKGGRDHRVPLSEAAVAVLERAKELRSGEFVFLSLPHDRPLSNMAMLSLLARMHRSDLTVHGFRATFRTWAGECTRFPREIAEAALAHVVGDETERAYQRGDLLERRRELMREWSIFCSEK
jgi:integrase